MLPASLISCSGNALESGSSWGMGPVGGRKGEGRLSRTIIRDGGMSLGLIEEIRGHQGKKDCCETNVLYVCARLNLWG